MSAQGMLEGILGEVHEELCDLLNHRLPTTDVGKKFLQETVVVCEGVLNAYTQGVLLIDKSPKAAQYWRENLPQKEQDKLEQCEQWIKLLKAGYPL